jgi:hypothetical protein
MASRLFNSIATVATLLALGGTASAQTCVEKAAEGTGPTRDLAMRAAYDAALRAVDPQLGQRWSAGNMRIGEAPGYTVQKLTTKCAAGGSGQICRVEIIVCR